MCDTALADFRAILDTVGGATECQRAEELLAHVKIVHDTPIDAAIQLQGSAKVKDRAKVSRSKSNIKKKKEDY